MQLKTFPCLRQYCGKVYWWIRHVSPGIKHFPPFLSPFFSFLFNDLCFCSLKLLWINRFNRASCSSPPLLAYLHSGVVAALLHVQQSAALAARPELDLQAAGAGRVRGGALQGPSQQDVPFGSLLEGVVQTAGTIQGQGGVCCRVCGRKGNILSAVWLHRRLTANCKT